MRDFYGEPGFRRLLVWINANDGSGYGCIEINKYDEAESFVEQLRRSCARPVAEINYSPQASEKDRGLIINGQMYSTLENFRKKYGDGTLLVMTHLEESVDETKEREVRALLGELNMSRENFVNYPSQVIFVFRKAFMDRVYQSAHDFTSMMGIHEDLTFAEQMQNGRRANVTAEPGRQPDMAAEPDRPINRSAEPVRSAPNKRMRDIYLENFKNKKMPVRSRMDSAKKYIDICAYYNLFDEASLLAIREILSEFDELKGPDKVPNKAMEELEQEVCGLICSNPQLKRLFEGWTGRRKKPAEAEKSENPEKPGKAGKAGETGKSKASQVSDKPEVSEKPGKAGETGKPKTPEVSDKPERSEKTETQPFSRPESEGRTAGPETEGGTAGAETEPVKKKPAPEGGRGVGNIRKDSLRKGRRKPTDWNRIREELDRAAEYDREALRNWEQDNRGKALECFEKELAIVERVLGKGHTSAAPIYENMAALCREEGDSGKALDYYRSALAILEREQGKEHPATADLCGRIALLLREKGDYGKALEYGERALVIRERELGREHPVTAAAYMEMAGIYEDQGDYAKALKYAKKAYLSLLTSAFGEDVCEPQDGKQAFPAGTEKPSAAPVSDASGKKQEEIPGSRTKPESEREKTEDTVRNQSQRGQKQLSLREGDRNVRFGRYPYGEKGEKKNLLWRVLKTEEDEDGGRALLITEKLIDCMPYHRSRQEISWEGCSLRDWMNSEFIREAFKEGEAARILPADDGIPILSGKGRGKAGGNGSGGARDKVFALSTEEAKRYFDSDSERRAAPTPYAKKRGSFVSDYSKLQNGEPTGWWWLRLPGSLSIYAASVRDGVVCDYGHTVDGTRVSVRPALWLKL